MREFLFRGKRIGNGEWIYGYYVHQYGSYQIYVADTNIGEFEFDQIHIDPETAGQFTGLTDKNGKKIFEGDIVKTDSKDTFMVYGKPYVVEFDDEYECGFVMRWKKVEHLFGDIWNKSEILEIIGNIHDNPELLEVR